MYHHATPSPQHHPSRRRRGDRVQISRLTARHTRAVFTGHVHRIPSLRLITTTDSASRVRARATLYPRQPIPRSEPGHVPACVFRVTSAPAPSCMGSLASYTWQQLREVRPVKLDSGYGRSARQPAGSGACPCSTGSVCTVSQGAQLTAAGWALVAVCTPVLLDCRGRRKKRWEWQPKSH
jgi:hypothetical protein